MQHIASRKIQINVIFIAARIAAENVMNLRHDHYAPITIQFPVNTLEVALTPHYLWRDLF